MLKPYFCQMHSTKRSIIEMIYDKWQKLIHQDMKNHIWETVQTFKKNLFFVMSQVQILFCWLLPELTKYFALMNTTTIYLLKLAKLLIDAQVIPSLLNQYLSFNMTKPSAGPDIVFT